MTTELHLVSCRHLYIHTPFCCSRCRYCAFYAGLPADSVTLDRFVTAVWAELERRDEGGGPWATVYLGGGTPSLLGPERVERLLAAATAAVPLAADAEVTLEANPETLDRATLAAFAAAGINRVSIGVQSLHDAHLRTLGRVHDAARAREVVRAAVATGLRVSADLMYRLPGQTVAQWREDLAALTTLGVEHVSAYELSLEEGTPLAGEAPDLPGDAADWFAATHETLAALGFLAYEVSSFARNPDARSRHNLATWAHRPYLGLGPGAHSYCRVPHPERRWNRPDLAGYLASLEAGREPPHESESLTAGQLLLEHVMLGLRTVAGIDLAGAAGDAGEPAVAAMRERARPLVEQGLLVLTPTHLRPTAAGLALADHLATALA